MQEMPKDWTEQIIALKERTLPQTMQEMPEDWTEQVIALRERTVPLLRSQEPWTEDELQQVDNMFRSGVGLTQIALELHRSEMAIVNRVKDKYPKTRSTYRRVKGKCGCLNCLYYRADTRECVCDECALVKIPTWDELD